MYQKVRVKLLNLLLSLSDALDLASFTAVSLRQLFHAHNSHGQCR